MHSCRRSNTASSRTVRWTGLFLLVFQSLFLNVIVPGHARGMITMDGRGGCPACCCRAASTGDRSHRQAPTPADRANCAICNFAARITWAAPPNLSLPELGLVQLLPLPPPAVAVSLQIVPTYLGRAPPAVA